jgi:hypothetical protein
MENDLCLLLNAAQVAVKSVSNVTLIAVFLIASFKVHSYPVFVHLVICNIAFILTAAQPAEVYWLLCFISATYMFEYYYKLKKAACIPAFALSAVTLAMGCGVIFEYLGWYNIYDSLFNRYEIYVNIIYISLLLSLIDWRRVQKYLGGLIDNVRSRQIGFNNLFIVL